MTSDARRALAALALLLAACGTRDVSVDLYAPAQCCMDCPQPECPLARVRCVETTLERVDGTPSFVERTPVDEGELCTLDDLSAFIFVERVMQPSDSTEVRVEARTLENCTGELVLACDSFGDHVVDLERDTSIPVWCDCPYSAP